MKVHWTGPEVAEFLGVKPATIRAWRSRGQGPPFNQPAGPNTQATYDPDVVKMWIDLGGRKRKNGADLRS